MIKLPLREMKSLSRILTVCFCCVPAFGAYAAPVATTAGSNLTAYNPSNANNNQWATMTNGRYDGNGTAKVDFGNCNAVVLRCAQPKCGNGGCTDASVASAIVEGCVKSNSKCKQYGDDLVEFMTAQLVANSNAKLNQQQVALEQARIQAEAQAATASAQSEQITQMQNQMYQMQQQMAQQQAESAAALQEALAQQQAQSATALEDIRNAATDAAKQTEAGITAYQQEAINRGISEEVLMRQQITGQIQTEIENAETSLATMKKTMQNAFEYAGCDARGNNCSNPRRIKKWRELAIGFLTPYDNTIDKIYDALDTARMVGVDLSQIYAMLDDSCNSWSQYLCPGVGDNYYITYGYYKEDKYIEEAPRVCPFTVGSREVEGRTIKIFSEVNEDDWRKRCRPCTWLKPLADGEEIYAGWMDVDIEAKEQQRVVACSSNSLDNNAFFARRTRSKKGKGIVNIDLLDRWLNQVEPNKKTGDSYPDPKGYCDASSFSEELESKTLSRSVGINTNFKNNLTFCVDWNATNKTWGPKPQSDNISDEYDCPYVNPLLAICDTHPYNAGQDKEWTQKSINTSEREEMNRIIGLKLTVVSQQMYKQYEYLNATLRRLKTQLQKAVLTANLEAAGAQKDEETTELAGGKVSKDKSVVLQGAINCAYQVDFNRFVDCISGNVQQIIRTADTASKKDACLQLQNDLNTVVSRMGVEGVSTTWTNCKDYMDTDQKKVVNANSKKCSKNDRDVIKMCANEIISALSAAKRKLDNKNKSLRDLLMNE